MNKPIRLVAAAALTLALQAGAIAQTTALPTTPAQDVQRLAPQLVTFAGSDANFQALINGLSQGTSVTLTTVTADGFLQTVTFTPASPMSSVDIARTLETARQQLISRGVASPTAQQIGVTMAGGNLPTASGTVPVSSLVTTVTPGGTQPSASTGASLRTTPGVITQPTGLVRFTSDSGRTSNTSDTLAPSVPLPTMPPVSSPGTAGNGGPSPAEQLQRRR